MMLTRQNLKGGPKLKKFPLEEINGALGYKVGYCEGCNEPLLLRTLDAREILAHLHYSEEAYAKLLKNLKPKLSFKKRLIKYLVGKMGEIQVVNEIETVYN